MTNRRPLLAMLMFFVAAPSFGQITLVNMVPPSRSAETAQDAECSVAVNPANPLQVAASAFTWDNLTGDPMTGALAPIYVSIDGGRSWDVALSVPSTVGALLPTGDITLQFTSSPSGSTSLLYTAILHVPELHLRVYRSPDYRRSVAMTEIDNITARNVDQPHLDTALTTPGPSDAANDHVYVGFNNGREAAPDGRTASVDWTLNGTDRAPVFTRTTIEARSTNAQQNGYAIVPAAHPDGTVYAAFYGWRGGGGIPTDIVVVRDDDSGRGGFTSLRSGGVAGVQVVTGVNTPSGNFDLGSQRLGASNMAIAVDPRSSDRVYLAWADQPQVSLRQTIHVRLSTNRGATWSGDLLAMEDAVNPSLAVNSDGRAGLLYQRFTGSRWHTIFRRTTDHAGVNFDAGITLANTDTDVHPVFQPYIGDYTHLVAEGRDFYGVFSASNFPATANFPQGVVFQRYANFTTHRLFTDATMTRTVPVSIDPFFFHSVER